MIDQVVHDTAVHATAWYYYSQFYPRCPTSSFLFIYVFIYLYLFIINIFAVHL